MVLQLGGRPTSRAALPQAHSKARNAGSGGFIRDQRFFLFSVETNLQAALSWSRRFHWPSESDDCQRRCACPSARAGYLDFAEPFKLDEAAWLAFDTADFALKVTENEFPETASSAVLSAPFTDDVTTTLTDFPRIASPSRSDITFMLCSPHFASAASEMLPLPANAGTADKASRVATQRQVFMVFLSQKLTINMTD
jgi:hypothetical protein